jgi:hypothetical protein
MNGMLEYWNVGKKIRKESLIINPSFHYSIIPVGNVR